MNDNLDTPGRPDNETFVRNLYMEIIAAKAKKKSFQPQQNDSFDELLQVENTSKEKKIDSLIVKVCKEHNISDDAVRKELLQRAKDSRSCKRRRITYKLAVETLSKNEDEEQEQKVQETQEQIVQEKQNQIVEENQNQVTQVQEQVVKQEEQKQHKQQPSQEFELGNKSAKTKITIINPFKKLLHKV